jgi:hypothetical protein
MSIRKCYARYHMWHTMPLDTFKCFLEVNKACPSDILSSSPWNTADNTCLGSSFCLKWAGDVLQMPRLSDNLCETLFCGPLYLYGDFEQNPWNPPLPFGRDSALLSRTKVWRYDAHILSFLFSGNDHMGCVQVFDSACFAIYSIFYVIAVWWWGSSVQSTVPLFATLRL